MSADQAAEQIEMLDSAAVVVGEEPVARILIKAGAVRLNIHGDPNVSEAVAHGPHDAPRGTHC